MSRWFWNITSGMGTIFVPVAEVLSPGSSILKLGDVAAGQPMALLAAVRVFDKRKNIFDEDVSTEQHGRKCKSKDNVSSELIPVSLRRTRQS